MAVIQPVVLDPIFNRYEPLRDQALEARIREVARRAGMGESRIYQVDKSRDTKAMNAFVNGWLGTRQIVIWDTMLDRLDEDEVLAIVGHEMGHYKLDHVLRGLVVASGLILAGLWVVHLICQTVIRREGSRLGIRGLSDVASLPLLLTVGNAVTLLVVPIGYAHSRYMEREADRFGLELTRLNRAAATSFVAFLDSNLSNPRPGPVYNFWRATHPSLSERINFCNEYHPWNEGKPLVYAHLMARGGQEVVRPETVVRAGGLKGAIAELPGVPAAGAEALGAGTSAPLDGLGAAQ
jgi:Zn-dependent protease with chaperone function